MWFICQPHLPQKLKVELRNIFAQENGKLGAKFLDYCITQEMPGCMHIIYIEPSLWSCYWDIV